MFKAKGDFRHTLVPLLGVYGPRAFLGRKLPFRDDFDVIYSPFKLQVIEGYCLKVLGVFRAL